MPAPSASSAQVISPQTRQGAPVGTTAEVGSLRDSSLSKLFFSTNKTKHGAKPILNRLCMQHPYSHIHPCVPPTMHDQETLSH